jgi:hypothetical protein
MANLGIGIGLGIGVTAAQLSYPLINGYAFSYASVELKFNIPPPGVGGALGAVAGAAIGAIAQGLQVFKGVKAINYSAPTEETKLWGAHPEPYSRTVGKQDYDGDIELYLAEASAIQGMLGPGWTQVQFEVHITYSTPGYPMIFDRLIGCRLLSPETGSQMGSTDGITRKYKLPHMTARYDGNSIVQNPLAGLLT